MCTTRRFKSNYRIESRERIPLRSAEFSRYPAEAEEAEAIRTQRPFGLRNGLSSMRTKREQQQADSSNNRMLEHDRRIIRRSVCIGLEKSV